MEFQKKTQLLSPTSLKWKKEKTKEEKKSQDVANRHLRENGRAKPKHVNIVKPNFQIKG